MICADELAGLAPGTLINAAPNAYVLFAPDLTIVGCNEAYVAAVHRPREAFVGLNVFEAFPSDPASESYRLLRKSLDRVLHTHEPDHIAFIPYDTSIEGQPPLMRYWSATHVPILSPDGSLRFILQHTADITDLLGDKVEPHDNAIIEAGILMRANKIQAESERLRDLFDQAPGFIGILRGRDHVFETANSAYQALVGHRPLVGLPVREALPEVVAQGFIDLLDTVFASGVPYVGRGQPVLLSQAPGLPPEERFVDFVYQPLRDARGSVYGIFVQGNDVTEQQRAEERMATIARESAHRVKNTLAMAQAVVSATLRDCADVETARKSILARLNVLAVTQPALLEGQAAVSDVAEIVPAVMRLHVDLFGRIAMGGPSAAIEPGAAQGLALILHELATNAIKYGALSDDDGEVTIHWQIDPAAGGVALVWQERGGPVVTPPQAKGFGTRMIERALPRRGCNAIDLSFAPEGVCCRCMVELA